MSLIKNKPVTFSIITFLIAIAAILLFSSVARLFSGGDPGITIPMVKATVIIISFVYLATVILTWKPLNGSGKIVSTVLFPVFAYFSAILYIQINSYEILAFALPVMEKPVQGELSVQLTDSTVEKISKRKKTRKPATLVKKRKSFEPEMVFVEGGTFRMGNIENATDDLELPVYDEKPVHSVTVDDFYIGKFEVTQAQWKAVMRSNPGDKTEDSLPVERVSWNDCQLFIKKLNGLTGKKYQLPTEAQWEYASRGGNKSKGFKYSGSDDVSRIVWYDNNSGGETYPVGRKAANELGIYDMNGNVWEWCNDWYGKTYYSTSVSANPKGPLSGNRRVIRGGSYLDKAFFCRSAMRNSEVPDSSTIDLGLRLVLCLE